MTDEQIAKLPKWAQTEIKRLMIDLEHYKANANADANPDALVYWTNDLEANHGIPNHATVTFRARVPGGLPGTEGFKGPFDIDVRLNIDGDVLDITCDRPIAVLPKFSNSVEVCIDR